MLVEHGISSLHLLLIRVFRRLSVLSAGLLLSTLTVGIPAWRPVSRWLDSTDNPLALPFTRQHVLILSCAALGCGGLVLSSWTHNWWIALSGLILFFASWAPCNALYYTIVASACAVHSPSRSLVSHHTAHAISGDVELASPLLSDRAAADADAGSCACADTACDSDCVAVNGTMFGVAFACNATLSLVLQTAVQAVLYSDLNVSVTLSFQVLTIVFGVVTAAVAVTTALLR